MWSSLRNKDSTSGINSTITNTKSNSNIISSAIINSNSNIISNRKGNSNSSPKRKAEVQQQQQQQHNALELEPAFSLQVPEIPSHFVVTTIEEDLQQDEDETKVSQLVTTSDKFTSPTKQDRFQFPSPVPLPHLEEQSIKRRHEFNTRIYNLECKVVALTSRLANEHMDLELALSNHFETHTCQHLQRIMERVHSKCLLDPSQLQSIMSRLSSLQIKHARHIHVDLYNARRDELQSTMYQLTTDVMPSIPLECQKADKREGTFMKRFENMAGTVARRFHEESSSRKAALVYLQSLLDHQGEMDEQRAKDFLTSIQQLRCQLDQERENRILQDRAVVQMIDAGVVAMRRAVWEAADDSLL